MNAIQPADAPTITVRRGRRDEVRGAAVSWPAILAGVVVAGATALVLTTLAAGLRLNAPSAGLLAVGVSLCLIQMVPAWAGGYLAGRLRRRSPDASAEEVLFRDTAHGLLVWAVMVVLSAAFFAFIGPRLLVAVPQPTIGPPTPFTSSPGGEAWVSAADEGLSPLLRSPAYVDGEASMRSVRARQFVNAYERLTLAERVAFIQQSAARSGISEATAAQRVAATLADARATAAGKWRGAPMIEAELVARERLGADLMGGPVDTARPVADHASLWLFVSLLLGALAASASATLGGRRRDLASGVKP